MDKPFSNREVKQMFTSHEEKDDMRFGEIREGLADLKELNLTMHEDIKYTNGKVKKLTLALVAVACLAIGMGINNGSLFLKLLGV